MIEKIPKPQEKYKDGFDWLQRYNERNEEPEPSWQSRVLEGLGIIAGIGALVAVAVGWVINNG